LIKTILQWSDFLVTFVVALCYVGLPALLALLWMSRRSENGLDWGPRPRLLAVGIAFFLIFALLMVFSYIYRSGDSWSAWHD
jgi:hypothetical protein